MTGPQALQSNRAHHGVVGTEFRGRDQAFDVVAFARLFQLMTKCRIRCDSPAHTKAWNPRSLDCLNGFSDEAVCHSCFKTCGDIGPLTWAQVGRRDLFLPGACNHVAYRRFETAEAECDAGFLEERTWKAIGFGIARLCKLRECWPTRIR